jgi:hypothetical protein
MVAIQRACLVSGATPAGRTIRLGTHGPSEMACTGAPESDGTRTDDETRQGSVFDLRTVRTAWECFQNGWLALAAILGEANASASSCGQTMRSWWVGHRRSGTATALKDQGLWVGRGRDPPSAAGSLVLGWRSDQDNPSVDAWD